MGGPALHGCRGNRPDGDVFLSQAHPGKLVVHLKSQPSISCAPAHFCEAKSVMTEHGKSQPRVYDELGSSHEIVHQGRQEAIDAGIAVVLRPLSSPRFVRQQPTGSLVHNITSRSSPENDRTPARSVIRQQIGGVGFDAYCSLVSVTTVVPCGQPLPRLSPGMDHYDTFIDRIAVLYGKSSPHFHSIFTSGGEVKSSPCSQTSLLTRSAPR